MAASARAITPTLTGAFSTANAPTTPSPLGPNAAKDLQSHPSLNSQHSGTFGAQLTNSPKGLSPTPLSPLPLTGAAAMADERRLREQEKSRQTSPNPAVAVVQNLLGAANQNSMSRLKDAPPEPAQMSEPLAKAAKSIVIPDQVTVDNMQTSPVSLSSFGSADSTTAPTATAMDAPAGPILSSMPGPDAPTPQHQPIAPNLGDTPTNRAFTFPGPLSEHDPRAPSRQMSLPGFHNSPRSPSTKRHKCPYCSTDFTRHHNLKSHLLTHSQEKPYECPTCNARFRRLHDLKRHTKLHTGERPHTCDKCGRKFARGDALARHNKGQGGCAGRRSSFGMDDDMADAKGDDSMDGVVYDDGEDRIDDDDQDKEGRRRVSEPARKRQNTGNSTQAPSSLSSLHFAANQAGVFGQAGMTESPKPLSPGQAEQQRLGMSEGSLPGTRSPNMMHQQNFARGAGRGSSPMGIHHPHGTNSVPQLPSLPGLTPMNVHGKGSQGGSKNNGPSMLQHQQVPGTSSQPGSISSHGGSGGSIREVMGNRPDVDVWEFVRALENRMARSNEESEKKIAQLNEEVATLRAQLAQQQGAQPQQNH